MRVDLGYDFICANCETKLHTDKYSTPDNWSMGYFHTIEGYKWEPSIHLCGACWTSPKVGHKEAQGVFKKLAAKFGWLNPGAEARKESE